MERIGEKETFVSFMYVIIIIAKKIEGEGIHGELGMNGDSSSQTNGCALFWMPRRRGKQTNWSLFTFEPAVPAVLRFYELVI